MEWLASVPATDRLYIVDGNITYLLLVIYLLSWGTVSLLDFATSTFLSDSSKCAKDKFV